MRTMSDSQPLLLLDCRGELCPLPVARARRALHAAASGTRIRLWCTDPLAELDLRALCARETHCFESTIELAGGVQEIILRSAG